MTKVTGLKSFIFDTSRINHQQIHTQIVRSSALERMYAFCFPSKIGHIIFVFIDKKREVKECGGKRE